MKELTRDEFRNKTHERDKYKCVVCGEEAIFEDGSDKPINLDAHHIIERRLFQPAGHGYFVDNGATLCEKHHIMAETTELDCEDLRELCGITNIVLPEHFYRDINYDKWGNQILPNGNKLMGDLFFDESVQKILAQGKGVLDKFQKYWKYPRTYHLPWSKMGKDDRMLENTNNFEGKRVIVSIKMDGENHSVYSDYFHARSIDSNNHPSRNWAKDFWAQRQYLLDDNMRVCAENLYAVHSIKYENLGCYVRMFSMWIDNKCLSWNDTIEYAEVLNVPMVDVIYDGVFDEEAIKEAFKPYENEHEGYVIRLADEFTYGEFRKSVGKFVRPEFRQIVNNSHGHWISKKIEKNEL